MKNRILMIALFLLSSILPTFAQIGGDFNPDNPGDPGTPVLKYNLTITASPSGYGSVSQSTKLSAGERYLLKATPTDINNYRFIAWICEGDTISREMEFYYVMPSHHVNIVGVFEFNPTNPSDPIGNMWYASEGLVYIRNFKPGNLNNAISTLSNAYNFSYQDVKQIIVIGKMSSTDFSVFRSYNNCTHVDLSRVTDVTLLPANSFSNSGIKSILLPASIKEIGNSSFYQCTHLTSIEIPSKVTIIGESAFQGCSGLTNIVLPESLETIGESAFLNCSGLICVNIPKQITLINASVFKGCIGLASVVLPELTRSIGASAFQDCSSITSLTIPSSVETIGNNAFAGCIGLTSLSWNAIDCYSNGNMSTQNIVQVTIGNDVKSLPYNFVGESKISSITIPNSVEIIRGSAFYDCKELVDIHLSSAIREIPDGTFSGCSKLKSLTLPDSTKYIGSYAFLDCSSLTNIIFPQCVHYIGSRAFENCTSLACIDLPQNVDSIGYDAFKNCSSLTSITFPQCVHYIGSRAFENCTSLVSIIIPDEISTIEFSTFAGCSKLTNITLGSSVEIIESSAFRDCFSLMKVISLPLTPPYLNYNSFDGVPASMTVYVMPNALNDYKADYYWGNFNIMPLKFDVSNLTVNLPDSTDITKYANMKLSIHQKDNEQSMHYIIGSQRSYIFPNLDNNTSWDVTLANQYGDRFSFIDNVLIDSTDVTVMFPSIKNSHTVTLTVKTPYGQVITDQTNILWLDESSEMLTQGKQIDGLPAGKKLTYSVRLPLELATAYSLPANMTYTVKEGTNNVVCQLTAIAQVHLSGKVKDAYTNQPLYGATISATQTFAGGNSKTLTAQADNQGAYLLEASKVPTTMTFAAQGYLSQTLNCDELMTGGSEITLPDVSLNPIAGAMVNVNFTFTPAHVEGEAAETQNWYSDYNNVDYEVYNRTTSHAITAISVQYPQIVLMEDISDGDVLEVTATSRKDAFMPVKTNVTISEQKASATFDIKELGKVTANFNKNINPEVTGTLYDAEGKQVKTADYTGDVLIIDDLADGDYTLVTMGKSDFFNSIYDINQFTAAGLSEGDDYVKNDVQVKSGNISKVTINEVPFFDESKFYYTGEHTSFTVNKPNIVIGNYLTFRAEIDFKDEYANKVSNVQLIIDLPESCPFVENSVLVGTSVSTYTINDNQITIQLVNYDDVVRFCAIPTEIGDFSPSAFVQFRLNGKTINQPIGNAPYTAKGLSISLDSKVNRTTIPVFGTAVGICDISIYDNDVLIGQTKSLANGSWMTDCELYKPYNLSVHNIYAVAKTLDGLELRSETAICLYDNNMIEVSKVIAYFGGGTEIVFDYQNPPAFGDYYTFAPDIDFSFLIDFTSNDTTRISNVVLYVLTLNGNWWPLIANYAEGIGKWVAYGYFEGEAPVTVAVDYIFEGEKIIDRYSIDEEKDNLYALYQSNYDSREEARNEFMLEEHDVSAYDTIDNLLEQEEVDIEALELALSGLGLDCSSSDIMSDDIVNELYQEYKNDYEDWTMQYDSVVDCLLDYFYFDQPVSSNPSVQDDQGSKIVNYQVISLSESELLSLIGNGYESIQLSDSSYMYYKYDNEYKDVIDSKERKRYLIYSVYDVLGQNSSLIKGKLYDTEEPDVQEESLINRIMSIFNDLNSRVLLNQITVREAVETMDLILQLGQTLYDLRYTSLYSRCTRFVNERIADLDIKIANNRSLQSDCMNRINSFVNMLAVEITKKNDTERLLNAAMESLLHDDLSTEEFRRLSQLCVEYENQINLCNDNIHHYKEVLKKEGKILRQLFNQIEDYTQSRNRFIAARTKIIQNLDRIPPKICSKHAVPRLVRFTGQLAGYLGYVINLWSILSDFVDCHAELEEWVQILDHIENLLSRCKDPSAIEELLLLKENVDNDADRILLHYMGVLSSELGAFGLSLIPANIPGYSVQWWIEQLLNIYAEWTKVIAVQNYMNERNGYNIKLIALNRKCRQKDPVEPNNPYSGPSAIPLPDPSGFVYEGVPSNRLEGVTATCYYMVTVEDMYGDMHEEVVLWDAENYGQENPLLTDENGYYRWDVPVGMWQVKYEKAGYETTYSDWLPVPPPQLDVNIGMVQMRQPEVIKARAYPKAVEFEFDKFMLPEDLTMTNIKLTDEYGDDVYGSIELLNAEVDDPNAITSIRRAPGTGLTLASKVRFNADYYFYGNTVTLTVRKHVKSYAGLEMAEDYMVTLPIEYEMKSIDVDTTLIIPYGDSRQLTVTVNPVNASLGKTLTVRTVSPMILSTDGESYTLDNKGQAVVTVHGDLPGAGSLLFGVDGYDLSAATLVKVMMENQMTVATPTATIASGSEVKKGTAVYLRCPTEDATIYYTLDGSCPCENTPARKVYDGSPIIIDRTMTIKAMATAPDLYDSDVATFVYRVGSGIKGDVNNDGEVNIADVNAIIGIILGLVVDDDIIYRADVNGDTEINIADVNEIIRIILGTSRALHYNVNCDDALHLNDVQLRPGEVRMLNVTLDNAERYSALQCDIVLPSGLTLVDVNCSNGRVSKTGVMNDSTTRAMFYSMNRHQFTSNGSPVITLTVRADATLPIESEISLTNVVLADNQDKAWHIADCAARVNNSSGINDLTAIADRVWVDGHTLFIETRQDGIAQLAMIDGVVRDISLKHGINQLQLERGIYIVVINGNSHKIAIK